MQLIDAGNHEVIAPRVRVARSFLRRARGLIGMKELEAGTALLIRGRGNVHTLFMRFPIDVIFCDRDLRVLYVARNLRPWRFTRYVPRTRAVIELRAGGAQRVVPGARLVLEFQPPGHG